MPKKRDYNAVMKPKRQTSKLSVSMMFSEDGDYDEECDLSDAISNYSQSTNNTDTLRSGVSSFVTPPTSPTTPKSVTSESTLSITPSSTLKRNKNKNNRQNSTDGNMTPKKSFSSEKQGLRMSNVRSVFASKMLPRKNSKPDSNIPVMKPQRKSPAADGISPKLSAIRKSFSNKNKKFGLQNTPNRRKSSLSSGSEDLNGHHVSLGKRKPSCEKIDESSYFKGNDLQHEKENHKNHQVSLQDTSVIYNDFEEMEALLLEKEKLAEELDKEKQSKQALEEMNKSQIKMQEEMFEKIKSLENEITSVDNRMAKMKISSDADLDDLMETKRNLAAKLIMERGRAREDDLISISGMSIYSASENGLMLNQEVTDISKCDLLDKLRTARREKTDLEQIVKQVKCDMLNERRKQEKVIKELMAQIRSFHMPIQRSESSQETVAIISDLKVQVEQLTSQNKTQTKLIERLVAERNHHLNELARLKGNVEEGSQLEGEV